MVFFILSVKNLKRRTNSNYFSYLYCVWINHEFFITITMTNAGDVIHHHEEKIRLGAYKMIENVSVKHKHVDRF